MVVLTGTPTFDCSCLIEDGSSAVSQLSFLHRDTEFFNMAISVLSFTSTGNAYFP